MAAHNPSRFISSHLRIPSVTSTQIPTSTGSLDISDLQITCTGRELLSLLTQTVASNTRYAKGHENVDVAIRRFLRGPPSNDIVLYSPSLSETHGYEIPDFSNDKYYEGLRYQYLNVKWELDRDRGAPNRPEGLGVVPCFTTYSALADHSLTFGTPIIGDGRKFKRAILLQPMFTVGCWQYILAQTERGNIPIYIRVLAGKAVPYWPHMHSPHLLLLAEIAPLVTGLAKPGLENIQKAADECYRPPFSVPIKPLVEKELQDDEMDEPVVTPQQWPGYPVLGDRRQLGDWVLRHLSPLEETLVDRGAASLVPVPTHWCEPASEPPEDDLALLFPDPSLTLRTRGRTIIRQNRFSRSGSRSWSRSPTRMARRPAVYDDMPPLGTFLVTPPHSEAPSSIFSSPSVETLTLRNTRSMLSIRPLTARIRKFSLGRKKDGKEKGRH
ncbi:hypothetical protein V5O48_007703 [Marasmius crinis-equi]|uniref:Uncharacterized protein n=1 Tax=Marasmius crinis-equi TaxID=585013 RepID=A0ABR3FFX5_9AGAR